MDLHLDDRLLHGRIIHGWGDRWRVERYLLCSERLTDPLRRRIYQFGPELKNRPVECLVPGLRMELPEPRAGDFWLTDSCAAAALMLDAGLSFQRLILIGLRDRDGKLLGEELFADAESMVCLRRLSSRGIQVIARRFPGDKGLNLFENDG